MPAAERTHVKRVGVAATEASAKGDYLKRLIREHANGVEVLAAGCPRLVTLAEAGILDGPEAETAVREYVEPMLAAGIDELVLGCTHFPVTGRVQIGDIADFDRFAVIEAAGFHQSIFYFGLLASIDWEGEPIYPEAYVTLAAPACIGYTDDGCPLRWQSVRTDDGREFDAAGYFPHMGGYLTSRPFA